MKIQNLLSLSRATKIKVSLIDSVDVFEGMNPIEGEIRPGNCELDSFYPSFVTSHNRELQTKINFERLYRSLNKKDKMIIVYHQVHLVPNFIYCRPSFKKSSEGIFWTTDYKQLSWFGLFLDQHGRNNISYSLVLTDEVDTDHNPKGAFRFSKYLREQNNSSGVVAWNLKHRIPSYENQTGTKMFNSEAFFLNYMDGQIKKTENIFKTADFLIWGEYAQENYSYSSSSEYIPMLCH